GCYYVTMNIPDRRGDGMMFSSSEELHLAHALGKIDTHARIKYRLPPNRRLKGEGAKHGAVVETTVGRVLFNDVLPEGMPFYNIAMRSSELAKVISASYQ